MTLLNNTDNFPYFLLVPGTKDDSSDDSVIYWFVEDNKLFGYDDNCNLIKFYAAMETSYSYQYSTKNFTISGVLGEPIEAYSVDIVKNLQQLETDVKFM